MELEQKTPVESATYLQDERPKDSVSTVPPREKLDRYINFIPTIAFGANLQASWESVAVSFQAGLMNGGPTALVWGTLIAWIGSLAMAASLAEMASNNPTVGAQYRWTSLYKPPGVMTGAFWGLIQGWLTCAAWIATVAQPAYFLATLTQGMIVLNHDTYVPEGWHGTLLAWGVLAIVVLTNLFARRILPTIEVIGAITHISFFIVFVITLAVLAPRSSASFVFGTSSFGLSGWQNQTVQWCIGLISATFPIGGFDGVLHMSDEVKDAPRKVPLAMISSVLINGAMAFSFMITLMFCLGDLETALTTPTGYPILQVVYGATGSKAAATAFGSFIFFNGLISMFSSFASVTRLLWAFARDKGLPFSGLFSTVSPSLRIPLNSLILVSVLIAALQLINIGSSSAFYAIVGLSTIGLYLSYVLPILFIALAKIRGDNITYGPIKLGKFGLAINIFAVVYGVFMLIFLPFPPYMPVTAQNMNYAGPILGFVLLFALSDWFISGRKRFQVPVEHHTGEY